MLNLLGNLAALPQLMRQAQQVGAKMQSAQAELAAAVFVGSSGDGVEVEFNGAQQCRGVRLTAEARAANDLEARIERAIDDGLGRIRARQAELMRLAAGDLPPEMHDMLRKFGGGG
jgi:DNA-binding protein YbaB